nr:uncharacterized protein LOC128692680 isoform X2 [Cherax quadricarinatus]
MRREMVVTLLVVVGVMLVGVSDAHVALTFPPARKYNLDFLDTFRTQAPCGMPKGNIRTSLLQGSSFNVTWHLAYPHRGGFRLELLDAQERPLTDLTPVTADSKFLSDDATAQSFRITLPTDLECIGCTIRLLRQATEWGGKYQFWSCADVDIVQRNSYRETCSGNGRYMVARCRCNKRFFGDRCQYENECDNDDDCGLFGRCVDLDATTYPKKICYCRQGRFGPKCTKTSLVTNRDTINLKVYYKKDLSEKMTLYWRILQIEGEIEVVLVNNGSSYVSLGWRPQELTTKCKQFPYISGTVSPGATAGAGAQAEPEPESEPEAEPDATAKSKDKVKPDGAAAEPEPEADLPAGAKSEADPTAEPEPQPTEPTPKLSLADRVTGLLVPRGKRDTLSRKKRFAVPLLKAAEKNGTAGAVMKDEAHAEPEAEAETTAEPNAKAEPEPEAEAEPEPLSGDSPYVPKGDFHAMDCTDIVIGSAVGHHYRIDDYYTRDRSTPKVDSYWGGDSSLTAALGWEADGVTTILFRRKLEASHPTDHSITNSLMHVIWARGQEAGMYVHSPTSGLESGSASVPDFYRPDEIKYHGKKGQRGVVSMNFLEKISVASSANKDEINWCGNHWKYPGNCKPGIDCEYYAKWEYFEATDDIKFTIQTSHNDRWTGIGFSDNTRMTLTDAVIGWVERSGRYFMFDAWCHSYAPPSVDPAQGIRNESGYNENGISTISFVRNRISKDTGYDLSFTDNDCLYMMFPTKGGTVNYVNKRIRKHEAVPTISSERVCIRSCSKFGGADGRPFVYTTTPRPPQLHYEVEVMLTNVGSNYQIPEPGSTAWRQLSDSVRSSMEGVLKTVPGYQVIDITNLKYDGKGNLLTKMEVVLDKTLHEAKVGEVPPPKDDTGEVGDESMVRRVLREAVEHGSVGALQVNPQYLRVNQLRGTLPMPSISFQDPSGERIFQEPSFSIAPGSFGVGPQIPAHRTSSFLTPRNPAHRPTAEQQSQSEPEPDSEPHPEPESKPHQSESEPHSEPESEPHQSESEPYPEPESEPHPEPEPQSELNSESDSKSEPEPKPESESGAEIQYHVGDRNDEPASESKPSSHSPLNQHPSSQPAPGQLPPYHLSAAGVQPLYRPTQNEQPFHQFLQGQQASYEAVPSNLPQNADKQGTGYDSETSAVNDKIQSLSPSAGQVTWGRFTFSPLASKQYLPPADTQTFDSVSFKPYVLPGAHHHLLVF